MTGFTTDALRAEQLEAHGGLGAVDACSDARSWPAGRARVGEYAEHPVSKRDVRPKYGAAISPNAT